MTGSRVARLNPVAALGAALLIDLVLLLSVDPATAAVALAVELLLTPLAALPAGLLLRRSAPIALAAALGGLSVVLYGRTAGTVHARWLAVVISDGSITLGVAIALRVLAIALPAVVLLAGLDATRLADAAAQRLHLPARFVVAGLAGTRLIELLGDDWRTIALARRARGVGDGGPLRLPGRTFALLVVAVRRATALATAMEARGFGGTGPRSWARASTFSRADVLVVAAALVVVAATVAAGALTGAYGA